MTLFWLVRILVAGGLCVMLKWRRTGYALLGASIAQSIGTRSNGLA